MIRLHYNYTAGRSRRYFTVGFNVYGFDSYFEYHVPSCYYYKHKINLDTKITNKILHLLNISINTPETIHRLIYCIPERNLDVLLEIVINDEGKIIYLVNVSEYDKTKCRPSPEHEYTVKAHDSILYAHI